MGDGRSILLSVEILSIEAVRWDGGNYDENPNYRASTPSP